jgi:2-dehydro-3-deoxyphosphogluconate aldolase/(4S)-4-hydroxy-2-oxoglutarate aldolase
VLSVLSLIKLLNVSFDSLSQQPQSTLSQQPQSIWLEALRQQPVIAVVRASQVDMGVQMAQAVARGGIRFIEITWNSAEPETLLQQVQQSLPDCCVGVGTVLTLRELEVAISAGAAFCVSPHTAMPMIRYAHRAGIPMIPGAMTPTEIVTAWDAGATGVKVFPIKVLGGNAYLQALQGPLSKIPLIPTGGVTLDLAATLLTAGATAVGLSNALFPPADLVQQNWSAITDRAKRLVVSCRPQD